MSSNRVIGRKYALALGSVANEEESKEIFSYLKSVNGLFSDSKFLEIIKSPIVSKDEKIDIIISSLKDAPLKFQNFIKLLAKSDRLSLVPTIVSEMEKEEALKSNCFKTFVESNKDFTEEKLKELKETLSKKLGVSLDVESKNSGYDGVNVQIPDMGLKIDFSENHIKNQILTHILKAI